MAARFGAENAEAVLGVVVGDALDEASQHFLGDDSGCAFMSMVASSVSLLRAPIPRHIIADPRQHYHLPFKCTPWGYSCFRGGLRT